MSARRRPLVFATERLDVVIPAPEDADLYLALWNDGRVMRMVSFPEGLGIGEADVVAMLSTEHADEYDRRLLVVRREDGTRLGECKLGRPDENGLSETDVKLLPEHWGHGYGTEVKQGLVDHTFTHTDATVVQATPNKRNAASIRMQEAVGGVCVGEGVFEAPEDGELPRCDVPHLVYHVTREAWEARRRG